MSKELKALKNIKQDYCKSRMCPQSVDACKMCDIGILEAALISLETLRKALTISYKETPMTVTRDENGVTINSEVSLDITRNAIDEEFRKSLRQWILENACPKEVEALKIIKNKKVNANDFIGFMEWANGLNYYNEYCFKEEQLTQEEYDLLKEVLGNE